MSPVLHSRSNATPTQERGFSLIEVMVTIAIVSFGLLGIAGLLFSAINAGQVSMNRSMAVALANDMADHIRSNWKAAKGGSFDSVSISAYANLAAGCPTTCQTSQCTPTDQAALETCLWKAQLQKRLPAGQGSIVADPANLSCADPSKVCNFAVTVIWNESSYSSTASASQLLASSAKSYVIQVQP